MKVKVDHMDSKKITDPLSDQTMLEMAQAILRDNDRGGFTVPSARLYPFQWNWDAGITALGWMCFDEARAWQELHSLFLGQWENGLVPHIVFHQPSDSYFPGPEQWGLAHRKPPTTSITQPPLLATMVRLMSTRAKDKSQAKEHVAKLLPKLIAAHRWWSRDRDPENTGLVVSYHPWESGMDNSPAWDAPLAAVPPTQREYYRQDTQHVDAAQRPQKEQYDRYVYLLDLFRELGFDAGRIYRECPYRVADFGTNAILLRGTLDLADLCEEAGLLDEAREQRARADRMKQAFARLWNDEIGQYVSLDTRTGQQLVVPAHAGFLAAYARVYDDTAADQQFALLDRWIGLSNFALASLRPDHASFEPQRYWRGPVWPHVNWMIAEGCAFYGRRDLHDRLRADTFALIRHNGFYEYFNPLSGEPYGGSAFSWTAAIILHWAPDA